MAAQARYNQNSATGDLQFAAFGTHDGDAALGRLCVVPAVLHVSEREEGLLQVRPLRVVQVPEEHPRQGVQPHGVWGARVR